MDYLRNLGSAAVSSLVQKSGLTLPFTTSTRINAYDGRSIWTLYEGTKRVRILLITPVLTYWDSGRRLTGVHI